ncbi:MAG: 30S ribosomal protein S7 [Candidatus Dojkabacteria bacterium]|jgi:small subunit ribosomal protein S7|nr:30S ribosomal protein S7 [Candidatus Dojkabacteria bacterium]
MRGKQAKKRKLKPDAIYESTLVNRLITAVMKDGKRSVAEKIVYSTLEDLEKELNKKPLEILEKAIDNVMPRLEVRPRRVGGVNYQVPAPVPEHRQLALAIKWVINEARARRKKETFAKALSIELIEAYKGTGGAMKKKEEVHKMAEANKAFAHFQW